MSRHRNVRSMNYSEEYDGYDDVYGHSVEDEYCVSPSIAAEFMYDRSKKPQMSAFFSEEDEIIEEEETDDKASPCKQRGLHTKVVLSDFDEARLQSCVEEIHNVIGDTVPENVLEDTIIRNNFDIQRSLDTILSRSGDGAEIGPKPQRERKERRREKDDDLSSQYFSFGFDSDVEGLVEAVDRIELEFALNRGKLHAEDKVGTASLPSPRKHETPAMQQEIVIPKVFHASECKKNCGKDISSDKSTVGKHELAGTDVPSTRSDLKCSILYKSSDKSKFTNEESLPAEIPETVSLFIAPKTKTKHAKVLTEETDDVQTENLAVDSQETYFSKIQQERGVPDTLPNKSVSLTMLQKTSDVNPDLKHIPQKSVGNLKLSIPKLKIKPRSSEENEDERMSFRVQAEHEEKSFSSLSALMAAHMKERDSSQSESSRSFPFSAPNVSVESSTSSFSSLADLTAHHLQSSKSGTSCKEEHLGSKFQSLTQLTSRSTGVQTKGFVIPSLKLLGTRSDRDTSLTHSKRPEEADVEGLLCALNLKDEKPDNKEDASPEGNICDWVIDLTDALKAPNDESAVEDGDKQVMRMVLEEDTLKYKIKNFTLDQDFSKVLHEKHSLVKEPSTFAKTLCKKWNNLSISYSPPRLVFYNKGGFKFDTPSPDDQVLRYLRRMYKRV